MAAYTVGQRVKLLAPLVNENSSWMPVEKDMPVGLEGTITHVSDDGLPLFGQLSVRWDNGRSLGLLLGKDVFTVISSSETKENEDAQSA